NFLVRLTRPVFSQYLVPTIRGKAFWASRRQTLRRKLITAGLKDEITADEFIAFKIFLIVFFPIVGGVLNTIGFIDASFFTLAASAVLGWLYSDLWMRNRIQRRQKEIRKSMPFIVDRLALSTEAGLDFVGAVGKVVEKATP